MVRYLVEEMAFAKAVMWVKLMVASMVKLMGGELVQK